jgi:hypothetical protein
MASMRVSGGVDAIPELTGTTRVTAKQQIARKARSRVGIFFSTVRLESFVLHFLI